jgi:hypothetical protein
MAVMVSLGFVFWRWMTLALLADILQPLIVALSIMAAALLVRLNRGMPALDWKSLEIAERKILTQKIVELTREYMIVLSLHGVTLAALLIVVVNKTSGFDGIWYGQQGVLAAIGALLGLCICRMGYIVWRDSDIVRLQKKLIDDSADREAIEKASADALSNVTSIRASGLREPTKIELTSWPDSNNR